MKTHSNHPGDQEMRIINITLQGGVIQDVQCPEGVQVVVRDYDTDGVPNDQLRQDDNGDQYVESTWK